MNRRRFIWVVGGGVAGGGALLGAATWWRGHAGDPPIHPTASAGLRVLSPAEHAVLAAAVATLAGIADGGAPALYLDGVLAEGPAADVADVRALLWLVEHGTMVQLAGAVRFTRLAPERRAAYLGAWGTSSVALLRTGFRVLKQLAAVAVWRSDEQWPAIGYGGPIVPRGWDIEEHGG